jgi:2-oxoglutarate ferredoxin oxidoreductase subunit alpha
MKDITIKLGGEAGQGLQLAGFLLAKVFARSGYHVFAWQETLSRVRGGHNTFTLRIGMTAAPAPRSGIDLLLGLDAETLSLHADEVRPDGLALLDLETLGLTASDDRAIDLPLRRLAIQVGARPIASNTVAVGAVLGLLGADLTLLDALLEQTFSDSAMATQNKDAARAGAKYAVDRAQDRVGTKWPKREAPARMLLSGNDAIAMGAVAAGCQVMSAYPMSPATSILHYLANHEDRCGIVTEQAEDEIAAASMALGASMAGVRAMTATSGGGFALMTETMSLAGVSETPIVVVNVQRPGPATGLPTRTEQGDLDLVLYAGHGEFPRAVFAPYDAKSAFDCTMRAFEVSDAFCVPSFVLSDQHLAESMQTCEPFEPMPSLVKTSLLDSKALETLRDYRRYALTESGVSPRAYPGQSRHLVLNDSHEHDEKGYILETPHNRVKMNDKRLRKHEALAAAALPPLVGGFKDAISALISWGSTYAAAQEAMEFLASKDRLLRHVHLVQLWPLPIQKLEEALQGVETTVVVEGNATGQLEALLRRTLLLRATRSVRKYDGLPFAADELAVRLEEVLS